MPRAVLVSAMMTSAREHANDPRGKLATDPVLISYLDQAYGLYYQTLVEADPAFYQTEAVFQTVSGTKAYPFPDDWISTVHVGRLNGSRYVKLLRLNVDEIFDYGVPGDPVKYQPEGGQLALYPTPAGVSTIKHIYLPSWTKLTTDDQSIDGLLGNEELIELEAAIRLRGKDEVEDSDLVSRRDLALVRLQKQAFQRTVVDAQIAGEKLIDDGPCFGGRDRDAIFW